MIPPILNMYIQSFYAMNKIFRYTGIYAVYTK